MKPTLLILAAGIGSRYGGLKQLDTIGPSGETIIDYSIFDAIRAGFGKVVFIIKKTIEKDFREVIIDRIRPHIETDYVFQEIHMVPEGITWSQERKKPWGTGHAVLMAAGRIHEPFAVINSDDFYGRGAYTAIADYYRDWDPAREGQYSMVGYRIGNTLSEFGSVSRGVCKADKDDFLVDVSERTMIERKRGQIVFRDETAPDVPLAEDTVVSMNFWGFTPSYFKHLEKGFTDFIQNHARDPKAEYYIPTSVNELIANGTARVKVLNSPDKWFGMTYSEDRNMVVNSIRQLVESGVYPRQLWQ